MIMIIKHYSFFQRGRDWIKYCQCFPAICYNMYFQSGLVRSGLHRLVLASVQRSAAGSYCCQVTSSTFASSILPIVLKVTASIIMVVIIIIIRERLLSSLFQVTLASPPFYTEDSASTLQVLGDHLLSFKHHRHHLIACIKFIIYRI